MSATGQSMHWLPRAILLCVGVIFVLFGGVCGAACLSMMIGPGANAPAAAKVGMTVKIVATVFFALVTFAGGFMIWVGVRRRDGAAAVTQQATKQATQQTTGANARAEFVSRAAGALRDAALELAPELGREAPAEVFAMVGAQRGSETRGGAHRAPYGDELPSDGPRDSCRATDGASGEFGTMDSDLGSFIARCGPELNGLMYNYVSAGIYLAIGLGVTIALPFMELAIQPGLGVVFPAVIGVAAALLHLWTPFFGAPQTIELYEFGIVEQLGKKVRRIEIATIEHLRVQEWYEHRFADRTFNVKATISGQKPLEFSTALRGDGDSIVEYLASRIHDSRTEFVEFKM